MAQVHRINEGRGQIATSADMKATQKEARDKQIMNSNKC